MVDSVGPVVGLGHLGRLDQLPYLDITRLTRADGGVGDLLLVARQALARFWRREDAIDRQKHVLRRAEGALQPHLLETAFDAGHLPGEFIPAERKGFRIRALEGIDRL